MLNGTAQKCDCCQRETLAYGTLGLLEITDRRHGQRHRVVLTLDRLVNILDPSGTAFVRASRNGSTSRTL